MVVGTNDVDTCSLCTPYFGTHHVARLQTALQVLQVTFQPCVTGNEADLTSFKPIKFGIFLALGVAVVWQENRLGPAAARVAHASVRVSTPLRRGAAPYADESWRLVEARTHVSLLSFEVQSRTEGGIYVTFCVRQDNIKSSVQFGQGIPKYTYPPV